MKLLDGKSLANKLLDELALEIKQLPTKLKLVALEIGEDKASELFLANKRQAAKQVGIDFEVINFKATASIDAILTVISELNNNPTVTGIMIQYPIPKTINNYQLLKAITPFKDVEGLTPLNRGLTDQGLNNLISPTALGVIALLETTNQNLSGKVVTLIGYGDVTNKPLAKLLLQADATVIVCNEMTLNLEQFLKISDIIISSVGKANLFTASMIKPHATVISVGISYPNDRPVADFDIETIGTVADFVSPVPGGTGPVTVAMLLKNCLTCYYLSTSAI